MGHRTEKQNGSLIDGVWCGGVGFGGGIDSRGFFASDFGKGVAAGFEL
jgi:hypothetical protein